MGAAVLSSKAALRSGIGLLTVHAPSEGINILQVAVPEAMCVADIQDDHFSSFARSLAQFSAVAIGPGIGTSQGSFMLLRRILANHSRVVIDADALNLIAENPILLEQFPEHTILTPHPKEFERLAGVSASGIDRLDRLVHFAQTYRCTVILKDAITAVATQEGQVFFNTTGNPGMATGGSGDVLTGIVLGLLSQGYPAEIAAQIAVYFHGKAGDTAAANRGQLALIAGDLIEELRIEPASELNEYTTL
jgi:NAD(P)H-hydrate epimerase